MHSISQPTSQAAVFVASGRPLELRQLPLPRSLGGGETLVRIRCCTVCGSDLHTLFGRRPGPAPAVLGHEIVGTVTALGDPPPIDLRGRVVQRGDRVVWSVVASCKQCRPCRRGLPQKCTQLRKYGHHRIEPNWQLSGGLAEYCHLVRGTDMLVIESGVPDQVIAPASCATATVAAALRAAGDRAAGRVLIIGAGTLGLTAAAMCHARDAESVTVCDVSPQRLEAAVSFGARHVLTVADGTAPPAGHFDLVLEMSGTHAGTCAALTGAGIGASVVLVGTVLPTAAVALDPEQLVRRLQSIHGVHNYAPDDLLAAVDFLLAHHDRYPFAKLVDQTFPLTHIHRAVQFAESARPPRIAVNAAEIA